MINAPKPPKNIRLVGPDPYEALREAIARCIPDIPVHAQPYAIDAIMHLITKRDAEIERVARIDEQRRTHPYTNGGIYVRDDEFKELSQADRIKELEQHEAA